MKGTDFRTGKRIPFYTLYRGVGGLEKKNLKFFLKIFFDVTRFSGIGTATLNVSVALPLQRQAYQWQRHCSVKRISGSVTAALGVSVAASLQR